MRVRSVSIAICASLLLAAGAFAQAESSDGLSLASALREALQANPDLIALRREYESRQASVAGARALANPMFETQIWGWPITTLNPSKTDMYMFMAEQELPGKGKRAARELVAIRDSEVSQQQILARANAVLNEVKQAYADVMLARATTDIYAEQKPLLEDMADAATLRYASAHSGQHDTVKSIVELSRLEGDVIDASERERLADARLNVLLGRAADASVPPLAALDVAPPPTEDVDRLALARNPDIALADAETAREEAELARLRLQRKPDLIIGGGYMLQPGSAGAWTAKAGIRWPNAPWSRTGLDAHIDAQEKKVAAARAQKDAVTNRLRLAARQALVRIDAARRRVELLRTTVVPHVEHAFDVARAAYASDRGEFADLLDTQRVLLETRLQLVSARADQARALADLQMALGEIPED
jgi:cobalt-zinc-cadmium efflux system outer membrane protein